jgi:hypothetical protein
MAQAVSPARINASDLPKSVRRRLEVPLDCRQIRNAAGREPAALLAGAPAPSAPATHTATVSERKPARWRCHACDREFVFGGHDDDSWAAAERHAGETGHLRFDFVLI